MFRHNWPSSDVQISFCTVGLYKETATVKRTRPRLPHTGTRVNSTAKKTVKTEHVHGRTVPTWRTSGSNSCLLNTN
jgi:hypothetical protein